MTGRSRSRTGGDVPPHGIPFPFPVPGQYSATSGSAGCCSRITVPSGAAGVPFRFPVHPSLRLKSLDQKPLGVSRTVSAGAVGGLAVCRTWETMVGIFCLTISPIFCRCPNVCMVLSSSCSFCSRSGHSESMRSCPEEERICRFSSCRVRQSSSRLSR